MLNIYMRQDKLTRKNFIKILGVGIASFGIIPKLHFAVDPKFPDYERLGRVCISGKVEIKSSPSANSQTVGVLYEDAVIPWFREVVAKEFDIYRFNQRWIETQDGFVYAPYIQPVKNIVNQPVSKLDQMSIGVGMWAEVTIPYADVTLVNKPSSPSWAKQRTEDGLPIRVYYGQVYYVDQIRTDNDGSIYYRVNPNYYGGLDMFWVPAFAMRPILPEDIAPVNPDVENKKIVIDVSRQTLSCFEGDNEVYYCLVSTGGKYDANGNQVDKWSTPLGSYVISRKFISLQMSGGQTGAPYDLPGIGWVSVFASGGVAIHATVWHNDFGSPKSHGCVNTLPEDANWIFRWSLPQVNYDPGMLDITQNAMPSTTIQVIES
jgi:lipoprotein-anchoring transpeptidase ErfK/SrfK